VNQALGALAAVLNYLDGYYRDSEIYFGGGPTTGNALTLLHVLDAGLKAKRARAERLERGEFSEDDYPPDL
jgi:hypothetical protein